MNNNPTVTPGVLLMSNDPVIGDAKASDGLKASAAIANMVMCEFSSITSSVYFKKNALASFRSITGASLGQPSSFSTRHIRLLLCVHGRRPDC